VATEVALIWARNGFKNLLNGLATLVMWLPMVGWIPALVIRLFAWLITLSPAVSIWWLRNHNDFITEFIKRIAMKDYNALENNDNDLRILFYN
jgi:hypothetical protein